MEHLESRRNEKEKKILQQKPYIDLKFKDEGMQLVEKYADRFQLNVDECNFYITGVIWSNASSK